MPIAWLNSGNIWRRRNHARCLSVALPRGRWSQRRSTPVKPITKISHKPLRFVTLSHFPTCTKCQYLRCNRPLE